MGPTGTVLHRRTGKQVRITGISLFGRLDTTRKLVRELCQQLFGETCSVGRDVMSMLGLDDSWRGNLRCLSAVLEVFGLNRHLSNLGLLDNHT